MPMQEKPNYTFMFFYSNYNPQSLRVKIALNEVVGQLPRSLLIKISEVDFDNDKSMCKKHKISGSPTLLIFRNRHLMEKYFGELDKDDFETIIKELDKDKH